MKPKPITLRVKFGQKRLTTAQEREVVGEGDAALLDMEAEQEAEQKAALLQAIRTRRQKLNREAKGKRCTDNRRKEIEDELKDFKELEYQECGTREPKHPSLRPSTRELGFETDAPSADEILEAATIQRGLRSKKLHLIFAKLAKLDPARWGEVAKREAQYNPKIERTTKRIEYGDIKEAAESKWSKLDRVIAGHYFKSQILGKPLCELSVNKASGELGELGVKISPEAFERALRRLCLVD